MIDTTMDESDLIQRNFNSITEINSGNIENEPIRQSDFDETNMSFKCFPWMKKKLCLNNIRGGLFKPVTQVLFSISICFSFFDLISLVKNFLLKRIPVEGLYMNVFCVWLMLFHLIASDLKVRPKDGYGLGDIMWAISAFVLHISYHLLIYFHYDSGVIKWLINRLQTILKINWGW